VKPKFRQYPGIERFGGQNLDWVQLLGHQLLQGLEKGLTGLEILSSTPWGLKRGPTETATGTG